MDLFALRDGKFICLYFGSSGYELLDFVLDLVPHAAENLCSLFGQMASRPGRIQFSGPFGRDLASNGN